MMRWRAIAGGVGLCSGLLSLDAGAVDTHVRLKVFASAAAAPAHDLNRQLLGTPMQDVSGDVRVMLRQQWGDFGIVIDHSTTLLSGDALARTLAPHTSLDQSPRDDDRRALDLTFSIEDGRRHRSLHRFDRLALQYRKDQWAVTVGRDAVSVGHGVVFSPMDIFNPFAPTVVDQDYKAGDDLLMIERLFDDGSDVQMLAVGRRNEAGHLTAEAGSVAFKWHGFLAAGEFEAMVARHFQDQVFAVSGQVPLGEALLRTDIVLTRLPSGATRTSVVANVSYSVVWRDKQIFLAAEYYRNGFGMPDLAEGLAATPAALQSRLIRGEVFNLMKDYSALTISIPWHPLVNQSVALITNLQDASSLIQTALSFDPSDNQRLQIGLVKSLGRAGDEFGGIPITDRSQTTGGGIRAFLRWAYYR